MDCIEHTQKGDKFGYATTRVATMSHKLHRVIYCNYWQIPLVYIKGYVIRHTCDNAKCINPKHLLLGDHLDNIHDAVVRDRVQHGEAHHKSKLTEDDVNYIRNNYKLRCKVNGSKALASKFNVHKSTITDVLRGGSWVRCK